MTGRELYEHLARRHPGLMVLYVSGYADDAFGREAGSGTAFLSKPFSLERAPTSSLELQVRECRACLRNRGDATQRDYKRIT